MVVPKEEPWTLQGSSKQNCDISKLLSFPTVKFCWWSLTFNKSHKPPVTSQMKYFVTVNQRLTSKPASRGGVMPLRESSDLSAVHVDPGGFARAITCKYVGFIWN